MYNNVLQHIENVAVWPVISFIIFFVFFLCLIWYVVKADKKVIEKMKGLPFENDPVREPEAKKKKQQQPIV